MRVINGFGELFCAIGKSVSANQRFYGIEFQKDHVGLISFIQISKNSWYFGSSFTEGWESQSGFLI
jgi:hypothetical protein